MSLRTMTWREYNFFLRVRSELKTLIDNMSDKEVMRKLDIDAERLPRARAQTNTTRDEVLKMVHDLGYKVEVNLVKRDKK